MLADILICLVLIAIVTSIVHSLIKNKKQGKSLCSGACTGSCAHCGGHCSHKYEKRPSKDGRFSWAAGCPTDGYGKLVCGGVWTPPYEGMRNRTYPATFTM